MEGKTGMFFSPLKITKNMGLLGSHVTPEPATTARTPRGRHKGGRMGVATATADERGESEKQ